MPHGTLIEHSKSLKREAREDQEDGITKEESIEDNEHGYQTQDKSNYDTIANGNVNKYANTRISTTGS